MRRGFIVLAAILLVAVVATVAVAADAPSRETKILSGPELAALTNDVKVVTTKSTNKIIHATKSAEPSEIDSADAMATLKKELTPEALAKATKITFTKVRFTDDLASDSVVAPNSLVWIATVDGFRSYSHGGTSDKRPTEAWDQMNLVIDAGTGEFLEAYPGVVGDLPGVAR